jgi:hypothetical protein
VDCPSAEDLVLLATGKIVAREELQLHLETCAACREIVAELTREETTNRGVSLVSRPIDAPRSGRDHTLVDAPTLLDVDRDPVIEVRASSVSMAPESSSDVLTDDSRYERGAVVAEGGAGKIFRAKDRVTGATVALKELHFSSFLQRERFAREAALLARVHHPNVVRFLDCGTTRAGQSYLVMEWLEGPTLEAHVDDKRLSAREAMIVGHALAGALSALHAVGLVHRDLKPTNVLLEGGALERATLLDFGLVRPEGEASPLTRAGSVLGTPGYMAPEQTRGEAVDARTDLFSLGCVLYRLLMDQNPFGGGDLISILARTALEEPPPIPLSVASHELTALVTSLLAKEPAGRPESAFVVEEELSALLQSGASARAPLSRSSAISTAERRIAALVLVRPRDDLGADVTPASSRLIEIAREHGARLEWFPNGTALLAFARTGAGTGTGASLPRRAAHAARALFVGLSRWTRVVMVTGAASTSDPVGELMERAMSLVTTTTGSGPVIDEGTALLLKDSFEITRDGDRCWLGAPLAIDAAATFLGKPTPCVGRERQLKMLLEQHHDCVDEPSARLVVVSARAGQGKSRLVAEVARKLEGTRVWFGRPPSSQSVALYGVFADLLARLFDLDLASPTTARPRLHAGLASLVAPEQLARVEAFIGEAIRVPVETPTLELEAARRSPVLMGDQMRAAWLDLFSAALDRGPVALLLEDIHEADRASLDLVSVALRDLGERPLFVLATARPEVDEQHPGLWADRARTDVRLAPLPPRAAEQLVRSLLPDASPEEVARILAAADGNPFFLEGLVRASAEGRGASAPPTVIAMATARLDELGDDDRHLLRAASVFGAVFPLRGASVVSGKPTLDVRRALARLEDKEVVVATRGGEDVFAFRHDLLREAAYEALTARDRELGHRLAAKYLVATSSAAPEALAFHFERGGDAASAADYFAQAAESAFDASDFAGAARHAQAALDRGVAEPGNPQLTLSKAFRFMNNRGAALEHASAAMTYFEAGSAPWYEAVNEALIAYHATGRGEEMRSLLSAITARTEDEISIERIRALITGAPRAGLEGDITLDTRASGLAQTELSAALESTTAREFEVEHLLLEALQSELSCRRATQTWHFEDRMRYAEAAANAYQLLGDKRSELASRVTAASGLFQLGAYEAAKRAMTEVLSRAERMHLDQVTLRARFELALLESRMGYPDQATAAFEALLQHGEQIGHQYLCRLAHLELARVGARAKRFEQVKKHLVIGTDLYRPHTLALSAELSLSEGDIESALAAADESLSLLQTMTVEDSPIECIATSLRVLTRTGQLPRARELATKWAAMLSEQAACIQDASLRRSFLEEVQENAAVLTFARELLD